MAWFKVDDGLHDHRKTRKVRRSHPEKRRDVAPFGLWVLAGSWAGANQTNGFVPTEVLEEWDADSLALATRLVDAGLWWKTLVDGEEGYGFHDWEERNPVEEVDSGRYGNHLRWHVKRAIVNPECIHCIGANRGDDRGESGTTSPPESSPVPTRPDPSRPSSAKTRPKKRSTSLPTTWQPTAEHIERAVSSGVILGKEVERFRLHAETHDRKAVNWNAAFAQWLIKAVEFAEQSGHGRPTTSTLPHASQLELPPDGLTPEEYAAWDAERRRKQRGA